MCAVGCKWSLPKACGFGRGECLLGDNPYVDSYFSQPLDGSIDSGADNTSKNIFTQVALYL